MTKYSLETKLPAVNAYLDGVESFEDTDQNHNVNMRMLKNWVAKYREHGLAAFKKRYTTYSVEFKLDVLNYMNEMGRLSKKQLWYLIFQPLPRLEIGRFI